MPADQTNKLYFGYRADEIMASVFLVLLIAGLHFSRGMVSIATLGIWGAALFRAFTTRNFRPSRIHALLILLAVLWTVDGLRALNTEQWFVDFRIKLGFVVTAIALYSFRTLDRTLKLFIAYGLILSFLITSTASVISYFRQADQINIMLEQSKHVPLSSGMHHIHFGLFLAAAIMICAYVASARTYHVTHRLIFAITGVLLLFNLHVLSSRTGLTGFYAAGLLVVLMVVLYTGDIRLKLGLITGFVILPAFFIFSLPSMRSKMLNTREDLAATVEGGQEVNHKSFGMRVEAWKSTLWVIKGHWMAGIGTGNQDLYLDRAYRERNTMLDKENRISTHNQFLETFMTDGLPGFLSLVLVFLLSALAAFRSRSWLYAAFLVITLWGMQFESLLERQHGAIFVALFIFLYWPGTPDRKM